MRFASLIAAFGHVATPAAQKPASAVESTARDLANRCRVAVESGAWNEPAAFHPLGARIRLDDALRDHPSDADAATLANDLADEATAAISSGAWKGDAAGIGDAIDAIIAARALARAA